MTNENKSNITTLEVKDYSLIIAVVNKGLTDLVTSASRKAGGKGGTIMVARGSGNPNIAKFYGLAIQPEKEVVFIVVDRSIKDTVLKAIYDEAGLATKGQGIVFSLPISDAIGLTPLDESKKQS
jgi:nitrogen regulatory protein PII